MVLRLFFMELSYCTFEITPRYSSSLIYGLFVLRDKEGRQIKAYRATSGQPGYQYVGASSVKAKGIIPSGEFTLSRGYPSSIPGIVDLKGKGWFFPIEGNNIRSVGRSSIGFHFDGGKKGSSTLGCIGVENSNSFWEIHDSLMLYFKNHNVNSIPLKVIYK